jgi:hypothetical protein
MKLVYLSPNKKSPSSNIPSKIAFITSDLTNSSNSNDFNRVCVVCTEEKLPKWQGCSEQLVIQQPAGSLGYVSNNEGETTQFSMVSQFGNVGLLAHNHLAGKYFSQLTIGQEIRLVYGDGKVENFIVTEVLRYQALQPNSQWSNFRNLDDDVTLTTEQMFKRVYLGDRHVTFQTCIAANGISSWGRLFVIAVPKPKFFYFAHLNLQTLQ